MSATQTAFVCGATGTQGSAVARQLRAIGWDVHATTRNPASPAAQALAAIGVKVYGGDFNDAGTLREPMAGCNVLFMNLMPDLANIPGEVGMATNLLRAAASAGVAHVIYSSGIHLPWYFARLGADHLATRVFESKTRIEEAVRTWPGFKHWTILRPGYFMANFVKPKVDFQFPGAAESGSFLFAVAPDTGLPLIDDEDIGAFAVAAFRDPERFHAKEIVLVGEILAVDKCVDAIAEATGRAIGRVYLSEEEVEEAAATNPALLLQRLVRGMEHLVSVDETKSWGIPMGTFANYVARERKQFEETYGRA